MLPAFSSTKNARAFAVGLAAFGGAATGMATEFGKQYDVTVDALKKQNIETNFVNVLPEINWKPIFVTAGITTAITAASTLIATSPNYAVLLAKMKTKLGATNSNLKSKLTKFVEGRLAKSGGAVAGSWSSIIGRNINDLATAPTGYQFYTRNDQKFIRRLNASDLNTPQLTVRYGKIVQVTGKVLTNANEIKLLLKTDVSKAYFWSGRTSNGNGVKDMALEIAQGKGGTTLEGLLEKFNVIMPEWDNNNPLVVKLWEDVSGLYANQVSGEVRAVLGKNLRSGNIWETVELPRLKQNINVTKIFTIDPETKIETLLWTR